MKWGKKGKAPVQYAWVGRAGSLLPPPAPLAEPWGGGGWRAGSCLGILSREGGISASKPRVEMADFSGEKIQRIILAGESGRFSRQDTLAGHFGTFIWRVILAHLFLWMKYTSWRRSSAQFLLFSTVIVFLAFGSFHPRGAGSQSWLLAAEGSR